jgi:hypothetical protein
MLISTYTMQALHGERRRRTTKVSYRKATEQVDGDRSDAVPSAPLAARSVAVAR